MSFEPRDYLRHILIEADYLISRSDGLSFEAFDADETLHRAFVRSLEVIGEAAKKVPDDFRAAHPAVEWRSMAGMRDRLIHDYFRVGMGCRQKPHSRIANAGRDDTRGLTSARSRRRSVRL